MVLHSKFLYCKNKQCHQFISSQTSTPLGKIYRTFWWEKQFGNTTSLLEWKLFLHSACLSLATLVHSSEECGLKRYFEVARGKSQRGLVHFRYILVTPDKVLRSDPKLRGHMVVCWYKYFQGGWLFKERFHYLPHKWSVYLLCFLWALLLWIISCYFSPFCLKQREQVRRKGKF